MIYAELKQRVNAVFLDLLVPFALIYLATSILESMGTVETYMRISAFVFVFFIYDPLFVTLFGGTIGHLILGISVKRANNPDKKIYFHWALIRYMIKLFLGWISLLTVSSNSQSQAIHDIAVGSIVIQKKRK